MRTLKRIPVYLLVLAQTGCFPFGSSPSPFPLKSADGRIQITLPAGWKQDRALHATAELAASNRAGEMYVIVLSDNKSDYDEMSLEKNSEITRTALLEGTKSPQTSGPQRLTINGSPALQYEIQATVDNLHIVYLHTTVETAGYYHQILAWTLRSRFEKAKPVLQEVIASFREISSR
ncbi:MAG TPA: hypothetical protein VLJ37_07930 [bacterium]|nr:hypothetical protein [bacterium]